MTWSEQAWRAAYEILDDVGAHLDQQPVGVQARVEREAAAIRAELADRRVKLAEFTAHDWRGAMAMYVLAIYDHGRTIGVSPDVPSWDADWLGIRIAACAYLARQAAS